jgi:hypothetical protein
MRAVPYLCEFYSGICLTTEEKARKNLIQGMKSLSQVKKNLRVQYTCYQSTHTTHTLQNPYIHTHTLQNPHTHTHTRTHITKEFKTTTVQIKTYTVQDIPK